MSSPRRGGTGGRHSRSWSLLRSLTLDLPRQRTTQVRTTKRYSFQDGHQGVGAQSAGLGTWVRGSSASHMGATLSARAAYSLTAAKVARGDFKDPF